VKTAVDQSRDYWDDWAKQKGATAVEVLKSVRTALGR
jgi:hypothetical protein